MPRLAVILPVLNGEKHVGQAVRSTLRAMPDDAVLAVCNDGSTDRTAAILQGVEDPRLKVIDHLNRQGIADSLNELIDATDSEFVARMDGDDICLPWRFRLQVRQMKRPIAGTFSTMLTLRAGRIKPDLPIRLSSRAVEAALLLENPLAHPTAMLRRDALVGAGRYRYSAAEDYDLWLRMAANRAPLERSATPTVVYRVHDSQTTRSVDWVERLMADRNLREAYALHSRSPEAPWYDQLLRVQVAADGKGDFTQLLDLLRSRSVELSSLEQRFIKRRAATLGIRNLS